jgi:hypothetical protein
MCAYRDGKKVGGCLNVPQNIARMRDRQERNLAVINWMLSELSGQRREHNEEVSSSEIEMLRSGEFTSEGGRVTLFSLPKDVELKGEASAGLAAY